MFQMFADDLRRRYAGTLSYPLLTWRQGPIWGTGVALYPLMQSKVAPRSVMRNWRRNTKSALDDVIPVSSAGRTCPHAHV
jgi:hypothetical protein